MEQKKAIVWFRQDLRLHDNEALLEATQYCDQVIPVYVFDPRVFMGKTRYGFPKTASFRAQFILDSVTDLRKNLRERGSDLVVRIGFPEEEIFDIAKSEKTSWVFCNRERTHEEEAVQDALERNLWSIGQEMRYSRGKMLLYTSDLPFPVNHTPDTFTQFRKEVEKIVPVREPLPTETLSIPGFDFALETGDIPTLETFGLPTDSQDSRSAFPFRGGETAALYHLNQYFWEKDLARTYKITRNELIGTDFSTKFSPWLAQGCISPKKIYHTLLQYEKRVARNESTYWIYFELLWRDFFRLMGKKHGKKIFLQGGPKEDASKSGAVDWNLFNKWKSGKTGVPFIDANMIELAKTGFMSNRGRQNVASFLIHDLGVHWQMGAEYFESQLIDYDPCSNWGNWNYLAGVGSDPRENRVFNIASQAQRYDPEGHYVKKWLPELGKLSAEQIHNLSMVG